jgi:hypothetical protein
LLAGGFTVESRQAVNMHAIVNGGIDWPAWVQAVGSVLAIAVAIIIDRGEARRGRAERRAEYARQISDRLRACVDCDVKLELMNNSIARAGVSLSLIEMDILMAGAERGARVIRRIVDRGEILAEIEDLQLLTNEQMGRAAGAAATLRGMVVVKRVTLDDVDEALAEIGDAWRAIRINSEAFRSTRLYQL